jgi:hypothetical protein
MSNPNNNVSYNCTLIIYIYRIKKTLQTSTNVKENAMLTDILNKKVSQLKKSTYADPEAAAYAVSLFNSTYLGYFASEDRTKAEIMKDTTVCSSGETTYTCNCELCPPSNSNVPVCASSQNEAALFCNALTCTAYETRVCYLE